MSIQLFAFLLFLLLTCLLFRRPASATPSRSESDKFFLCHLALGMAFALATGTATLAQTTPSTSPTAPAQLAFTDAKANKEDKKDGAATKDGKENTVLLEEMRQMRQVIERLEARVNQLESEKGAAVLKPALPGTEQTTAPTAAASTMPASQQPNTLSKDDRDVLDFWRGTAVNFTVDGNYGYNFNRPIGRINLLRAYDVQSNSFSLNQATLVFERAPDVEAGRRFGARLDLMFGQATEAGGGNPGNELRPQAFRHIWQAYGTYVAPLGKGLTVDFGKFASSLGLEGNYTKDQINYTRLYLFNFLPYYHTGLRSNYALNDKLNVTHYLVNGIGQSEDFNGFKSQAILLNVKPVKSLSWNLNYYTGIEARDSNPALNPGFAPLPTQPGLSTDVLQPAPRGRTHIIDTYAALNATDKLTLAAQFDYVVSRAQTFAAPSRVTGGAAYACYQFTSKFALAGRAEYLSDRGGLFSGVTQALKETTATAE